MSTSRFKMLMCALAEDQGFVLGTEGFPDDLPTLVSSLGAYGDSVKVALCTGITPDRPPLYLASLHEKVFPEGKLDRLANHRHVQLLRDVTAMCSKIRTYCIETPDVAWESFKARQDEVRQFRIRDMSILNRVKAAFAWIERGLNLDNVVPRHGNGAVAEGLNRFERYHFPSWHSLAKRWYPWEEYGTIRTSLRGPPCYVSDMATRVAMVPKTWKRLRTISIEPACQQFLQQGQMRQMYQHLSRRCSNWMRLEDQTYNHELLTDDYVTIDLSDASDRVSTPLIRRLMSPKLFSQLWSTRTRFAKYRQEQIPLGSFAPMGSAVCFPIESMVFLAVVMAAWKLHYPKSSVWFDLIARVYGDDIIVPDSIAVTTSHILEELGSRVNRSKSCFGATPFRESCGVDTWNGFDVTPVYNKDWDGRLDTTTTLPLTRLNREYYVRGRKRAAKLCLNWAREFFPVPAITRDTNIEDGFGLDDAAGYPGRVIWNSTYHRYECLVLKDHRRSLREALTGEFGLFARLLGDMTDRIPGRDSNVKPGWSFAQEYE